MQLQGPGLLCSAASLRNNPLMSCRNSLGKLINQEVFPRASRALTTLLRIRHYCAFWSGHEIKACRVHWQRVSRLSIHIPRHEYVFPLSSFMRDAQLILEHPEGSTNTTDVQSDLVYNYVPTQWVAITFLSLYAITTCKALSSVRSRSTSRC
jgi:hypothetical protein